MEFTANLRYTLTNTNVFLNKYSRARHSWKATFYLIFFYNVDGVIRPSVRPPAHPPTQPPINPDFPPAPLSKVEVLSVCKICKKCLTCNIQHCSGREYIFLTRTTKCPKRFDQDCSSAQEHFAALLSWAAVLLKFKQLRLLYLANKQCHVWSVTFVTS